MRLVIPWTNACFVTEPELLGSSAEKTALAPIALKLAGGLIVWKACKSWLLEIEPVPETSILSNRFAIF